MAFNLLLSNLTIVAKAKNLFVSEANMLRTLQKYYLSFKISCFVFTAVTIKNDLT